LVVRRPHFVRTSDYVDFDGNCEIYNLCGYDDNVAERMDAQRTDLNPPSASPSASLVMYCGQRVGG
jgi:hypothetical protein